MAMIEIRPAVFVSGCHLCPSLMAKAPTNEAQLVPALIQWAEKNDIEIIPMQCPETHYAGSNRKQKGRAYYDKAPGFRDLCIFIAIEEADRIAVHGNVIGIVGVTTSPACGTDFHGKSPYKPSGIYMEELQQALKFKGLYPRFISIWPKHRHKVLEHLASLLKGRI